MKPRHSAGQVLQDFQRHCAVNGMLFASVPAGPGSSGGPLLNRRGESWPQTGGPYRPNFIWLVAF